MLKLNLDAEFGVIVTGVNSVTGAEWVVGRVMVADVSGWAISSDCGPSLGVGVERCSSDEGVFMRLGDWRRWDSRDEDACGGK